MKIIFIVSIILYSGSIFAREFVENTAVCLSSEYFDELTTASIENDLKHIEYLQNTFKCFVLEKGTVFSLIELNIFSASKIRVYVGEDSAVVYVSSDAAIEMKRDKKG